MRISDWSSDVCSSDLVYSASGLAANEFPQLDVSLRGAVSIARRLQDPLAELLKIEPKAIGVGKYQHDVDQDKLARALDAQVEGRLNAVVGPVNPASAEDRMDVAYGKSGSGRADPGGRRVLRKTI